MRRIQDFLIAPTIKKRTQSVNMTGEDALRIRNGNFSWDTGSALTLREINLSVKKGELLCVIGDVGSGKSTLLSAITGDIANTSAVDFYGSLALVQ